MTLGGVFANPTYSTLAIFVNVVGNLFWCVVGWMSTMINTFMLSLTPVQNFTLKNVWCEHGHQLFSCMLSSVCKFIILLLLIKLLVLRTVLHWTKWTPVLGSFVFSSHPMHCIEPHVRIGVTSRAVTGVTGEMTFR